MCDNLQMREFFNEQAEHWDEICTHDTAKLLNIIRLCDIKKGEKILDVACGTGVLTKELLKTDALHITAVDLSDKMIEIAKTKIEDERVSFIAEDLFCLEENNFNCIAIYSAYPHFQNKAQLCEKLFSLLLPGGRVVIAHSESKERINSCHGNKAAEVSSQLMSAAEEAARFSGGFTCELTIDNSEIYVFCLKRKDEFK